MMDSLFFELIRVAIGTQDRLSRTPSSQEWKVLYDMAKKQSLVGICFAILAILVLSIVYSNMDASGYCSHISEIDRKICQACL